MPLDIAPLCIACLKHKGDNGLQFSDLFSLCASYLMKFAIIVAHVCVFMCVCV